MYLEKNSKLTKLNYKTKDSNYFLTAPNILKRVSYKQTKSKTHDFIQA